MDIDLTLYLFSLVVLVIYITIICIRALINWRSPGAQTLALLMASMVVWAGFYLIEILHPALPIKIIARKALYLGMTLSPPLWLGFALKYTGIGAWWRRRKRIFLLTIPGVISFVLGLTNETHHWVWKSLTAAKTNPSPLLIEYGPAFWAYTMVAYTLIFIGIVVYIAAYFKNLNFFRVKTGIVLLGISLTALINGLFLLYGNKSPLDPTPLTFALSAPLIAWGYFRFGISNLFPLAASLVVENLQDAMIVLNLDNEITDLNKAASNLFNSVRGVNQKTIQALLPKDGQLAQLWTSAESKIKIQMEIGAATKWFEVSSIPITDPNDRHAGRVIIFHDVTREQGLLEAEKRRSQQLTLMEQVGRRIADSFDQGEILQRAIEAIVHQFGYPETAISLLKSDNTLEIATIIGTEEFAYKPGFKQELGAGIIGYTASIRRTYVTGNVSQDPHYFSSSTKSGSAICTPLFKRGNLFGVLYVESFDLNAFDELDVITLETLSSQISESLNRADMHAELQKNLLTLTAIQEVSKLVISSLDLETISQTVVQGLQQAFGYSHVSIYFHRGEYLHMAAQVGYREELAIKKFHPSQGVIGKTFRTREIQFIEDIQNEETYLTADEHIVSEICVPLIKDGTVLGVFNVESSERGKLKRADVDLLTTIAAPISVAIDNARLHAELKKMATTDGVTGLSNRHVFEQLLQSELDRSERNNAPTSLIVFDIDYFKEYNDTWGHPAGDARLKAIADIIKLNLRTYDVAARYGGDEFAIILSDCNQQNAVRFAERLSHATATGSINPTHDERGEPGHTLSIGVATYPQDASSAEALLIEADNAALRAKQRGRNRIKLASDYEST